MLFVCKMGLVGHLDHLITPLVLLVVVGKVQYEAGFDRQHWLSPVEDGGCQRYIAENGRPNWYSNVQIVG